MEVGDDSIVSRRSLKRKLHELSEDEVSGFPLNELNQDVLERVLSWLPTSSFIRLTSVCKRWKSVAESATFKLACSKVPSRDPWFYMVDSHRPDLIHHPVVFDSSEFNWKKLNNLPLVQQDTDPVASSGGLICFRRVDGGFIVTNPVTAASRQIQPPPLDPNSTIQAIAIKSEPENFKLVLVSGELPKLSFMEYNSTSSDWGEPAALSTNKTNGPTIIDDPIDECTNYFLTKCGDVVSTNFQRSPSKQYSSILTTTTNTGDTLLHYLSPTGTVVACNLTRRTFLEYPRLLPVFSEYSIDLVECGGEVLVVLLSEFLESASVRIWRWNQGGGRWAQVGAMPRWMSQGYYGKKVDLNCCGGGSGKVLLCLSSVEMCRYVMCDLGEDDWVELPECCVGGRRVGFGCGLAFEPRVEALS